MKDDLAEATIKGIMPTRNVCAIFLGCEEKTFVIYIDQVIANIISMTLNNIKKERPLTHDLLHTILIGFEIQVQRVVIHDVKDNTFFARIILVMKNELGTKILEVDARPSDAMIVAFHAKRPIYVTRKLLYKVEDMSEILERLLKGNNS